MASNTSATHVADSFFICAELSRARFAPSVRRYCESALHTYFSLAFFSACAPRCLKPFLDLHNRTISAIFFSSFHSPPYHQLFVPILRQHCAYSVPILFCDCSHCSVSSVCFSPLHSITPTQLLRCYTITPQLYPSTHLLTPPAPLLTPLHAQLPIDSHTHGVQSPVPLLLRGLVPLFEFLLPQCQQSAAGPPPTTQSVHEPRLGPRRPPILSVYSYFAAARPSFWNGTVYGQCSRCRRKMR